ncbi:MAG: ATP-binding protein, partial [Planctomycetes bacterium]|nr:ATP-binding protein [Planctomycetota bacterium]
ITKEPETGTLLVEHLERLGFEPAWFREGAPALAWVQQNLPQLVLLDWTLPDTNSSPICEGLKLELSTNLIPILLVSVETQHEDNVHGLEVGADYRLTRPFTGEQLGQAVHTVLSRRQHLQKTGTRGEVHFRFPSDLSSLEELNQRIAALSRLSGLPAPQVQQLTTAVREVGMNAIEWGHRHQVERVVTATYRIDQKKITITLRDTGPGFDPNPWLPAAGGDPLRHLTVRQTLGLREGGLGIGLARNMVDDLQYNDIGNEVRLVKFFPPREEPEA